MSNPIFVAIDTPYLENAIPLAKRIKGHVGGIKLGLEFFCANGHHGVHEVAKIGLPLFLDLKLHDIPNTVAKAMHAINILEPAVVTIHASGGRAMMEDAKAAAGKNTKVVGVTILTSLNDHDLGRIGMESDSHAQVERLADLAAEAGLDGIVCSGQEVKVAHERWKSGYFVVPGIRPAGGKVGDQKRVVTPRQAMDDGASMLVIGRPITQAPDPGQAARDIGATL